MKVKYRERERAERAHWFFSGNDLSLGAKALSIECSKMQHWKVEMREGMKARWECKTDKNS